MRRTSLALVLVFLGSPLLAEPPRAASNRWEADIQKYEAADRQNPPPKGAVVFVGSSSIRMWTSLAKDFAGTAVINRGFGGSQIADSAYYADRIILPYAPRMVLVYAGDNDLASGKAPAQLLSDYQKLVGRLHERLPRARIGYLSIKPSPARAALVGKAREANALIQDFSSKDPRRFYVDLFRPMLNADGAPRQELFGKDGLHLNAQGYALWTSLVAPYLK